VANIASNVSHLRHRVRDYLVGHTASPAVQQRDYVMFGVVNDYRETIGHSNYQRQVRSGSDYAITF
jgi:hypothetical protein